MTNIKKVILITGASSGLGKAMALHFHQKNHYVIGVSRHCKPSPELDLVIQADLTIEKDRQEILSRVLKEFGHLDLLINNAGIGYYDTWENVNEENLKKLFDLNFFSLIAMTQICLPELKKTNGSIINISSVAGKLYVPCMGPYCASKAAVRFFSDSLRAELTHHNVHVLDVVVGRINTGFSSRSLGNATPPHTPGGGNPNLLAQKLYHAWEKRSNSLTYPKWYSLIIPLFLGPLRKLYEKECLKRWKL